MVAALALLAVGIVALANALTGEPEPKGPSAAATSPEPGGGEDGGGSVTPSVATSPATVLPLVIRVTGPATTVVVRVANTGGRVLTNDTLKTGEILQYQDAPLQVVAGNGGSLQVVIYGRVQPRKPVGERGQWFVRAR